MKVTLQKTISNPRRNLKDNVKTEQCQKAEMEVWLAWETGNRKCKAVAPRSLGQIGFRSVVA